MLLPYKLAGKCAKYTYIYRYDSYENNVMYNMQATSLAIELTATVTRCFAGFGRTHCRITHCDTFRKVFRDIMCQIAGATPQCASIRVSHYKKPIFVFRVRTISYPAILSHLSTSTRF